MTFINPHSDIIDLSPFTGVTSVVLVAGSEINGNLVSGVNATTGAYTFQVANPDLFYQFTYQVFGNNGLIGTFVKTWQHDDPTKNSLCAAPKTTSCSCTCKEIAKTTACETIPQCATALKIKFDTSIIGQTIELFISKKLAKKVCKKLTKVVDADGYVTVNILTDLGEGFIFKGWLTNIQYEVWAKDSDGNSLGIYLGKDKWCSVLFYASACDNTETFILR